jgi:hypothetical protein
MNPIDDHKLYEILIDLINDQNRLINGYKILSQFERCQGFLFSFLSIIFSNIENRNLLKLSCSSFNIFLKKNWTDENYICNDEKLVKINLLNN